MTVPPGSQQDADGQPPQLPACARHPDRPTGLRCNRCDRPACPDCLQEASVGYQCVDCVAQGRSGTRQPVTVAGARLSDKPVLVPVLIAINAVVFLLTAVQAGNASANSASPMFIDFSLVPALVGAGEWWRLISSGFLHFGLIHLAMNMLALWVIGRDLELLLGRLRFGAVYALSLLGGSTAVFLLSTPMAMVAGASGAVYGLMGGIAVAALRLKISLRPVLTVIVLNIVLSLTIAQLSLLGHIGGLIAGALATAALVYAPRERRVLFQSAACGGLLLLMVVLLVVKDVQFAPML